ncbi:peptidyl-prolyl cis-trans isomerase [Cryomorpha ignava]|uniref:Peptidyl-prolyl cis-trans isomerase n=2 Tax=Cryomorpha ignava TaxID=101383 RepID=A0A7K3WMB7_9FLAO|nr:peptidyl-prolyl cis-trans isomerase [Cryomorpha ignava]
MEYVVIETNKGDITLELDPNKAPVTVANFLSYVDAGHYDNTVFHRVISNFMIQGGGFTADGTQKPTQSPIELESQNSLSNDVGTIAMARTNAPNSATAQFFINVSQNDFLNYKPGNPGYAVFGKVSSGMDVVNEIRQVETRSYMGQQDWPVEAVTIKTIRKEEK